MADPAQPAPPILASNLLAAAKAHANATPTPASSGSAFIDEQALNGGFRYGEITSIAGASGTGKALVGLDKETSLAQADHPSQLTYHALTSHLLCFTTSQVAIVDTTGAFSPVRLRDVLVYRLEAQYQRQSYQQSGYVYEKRSMSQDRFVEKAASMLDRVKVMRVFDLAGVIEAVGEVGQMTERASQKSEIKVNSKRHNVGDSEEESDEDDENVPPKLASADRETNVNYETNQIGMIIIDTISNVVSPLMSKSQTTGQALLVSFMRNLSHLTTRHHVCTILTNAAVGLASSSDSSSFKRRPEDNVSIFSSTVGKPALGKTFTYLTDTSIFLSVVPNRMEDAAVAFGDAGSGTSWRKAIVLEVVKDRCGTREGRWAAFEIIEEVKIVPCRS